MKGSVKKSSHKPLVRHPEAGMIFIMMALLSVVLLSMIGFALGIGFLATERSRLHTIGNLTALAAIDQYIRMSPEDNTEAVRRTGSVDRANFVASKNKLLGTSAALGDLGNSTLDEGGIIRFGSYFREDPTGDPCGGVYPCFKEAATGDPGNAVMVNIRNQTSNPIVRPLKGFLQGQEQFQLDTTSYATLVNQCVGHLLDVSVSVTAGHHSQFTPVALCPNGHPACDDCAANPTGRCAYSDASLLIIDPKVTESDATGTYDFSAGSLFAFDAQKVFIGGNPANGMIDCTSTVDGDGNGIPDGTDNINNNFPDLLYWCNMYPSREEYELNWAGDGTTPQSRGNRQGLDGSGNLVTSSYMLVNKLLRPSPMREFMLGANMALRIGERLPAESNRGFFWAFTGGVENRAEPLRDQGAGDLINGSDSDIEKLVTSNLSYLTQLTNMDILGGLADNDGLPTGGGALQGNPDGNQKYPNLLDAGFFPMDSPHVPAGWDPTLASTNPILVLYEAARVLNTACDVSARRSVFIYTDGMGTCEFMPAEFTSETTTASNCLAKPDGGVNTMWPNYTHFEYALLKVLIPYFQDLGINIHVMLDGPQINPNYMNREDPNHPDSVAAGGSGCASSSDFECYLDFNRATGAGFQGMQHGPDKNTIIGCDSSKTMFGCASTDKAGGNNDKNAFLDALSGYPNVTFGRSVPVWGEVAMKTGGQFCLLMNPGSVGNYVDHDGDYKRAANGGDCTAADDAGCCQNIFNGAAEAEGRTPCRLMNSVRTKDAVENRSLEYLPKSFQAAICAQRALETSPFLMAEPLKTVLN
jgi:hypothetical protein